MKLENLKKQKEALSGAMEMKPRFHLSSKDLPEIKKWKIGKEYEISLKVKQKGMHEEGKEVDANFEIIEARVCEEKES